MNQDHMNQDQVYEGMCEVAAIMLLPRPQLRHADDQGGSYIQIDLPPVKMGRRIFPNLAAVIVYREGKVAGVDVTDMTPYLFGDRALHPHIPHHGGSMCSDQAMRNRMQTMVRDGKLRDLVEMAMMIANGHTPSNAYRTVPGTVSCDVADCDNYSDLSKCSHCQGMFCSSHRHRCGAPGCARDLCDRHDSLRKIGDRYICAHHTIRSCTRCQSPLYDYSYYLCRSHVDQHFCRSCMVLETCRACGDVSCRECSTEKRHGICKACLTSNGIPRQECRAGDGCVNKAITVEGKLPSQFFNRGRVHCIDCLAREAERKAEQEAARLLESPPTPGSTSSAATETVQPVVRRRRAVAVDRSGNLVWESVSTTSDSSSAIGGA